MGSRAPSEVSENVDSNWKEETCMNAPTFVGVLTFDVMKRILEETDRVHPTAKRIYVRVTGKNSIEFLVHRKNNNGATEDVILDKMVCGDRDIKPLGDGLFERECRTETGDVCISVPLLRNCLAQGRAETCLNCTDREDVFTWGRGLGCSI